jgi:extradiol dioxygenase family protein
VYGNTFFQRLPCVLRAAIGQSSVIFIPTNFFGSSVGVILITSLDPEDRARAEAYDVVHDFLNKSLTTDDLQRLARDICLQS